MKVKQLMSKPAITCGADASLDEAAGKMWDHDCGALPVVDQAGAVIGMITDRDICMAAYTKGRQLSDIRVADISNGNLFLVRPNDSIQHAETVMREHQVRRVPVIDDQNALLGVLSLNDIAREGERERSQKKRDIDSDEVLLTLAAVSRPNPAAAHASA